MPAPLVMRTIKACAIVALVGLTVLAFAWDAALFKTMTDTQHMNDFGKFYYSTRAFLEGRDMYAPSPATDLHLQQAPELQLLDLTPPHFHMLVVPFALLSPRYAIASWMAIGIFALLLSMMLILLEVRFEPTPVRLLAIAFGTLAFCGTQAFFGTGQLSMLLLLAMTICWLEARRGRWRRAGIWLGACLSVKPFLLIFVPYLLGTRRFAAVGLASSTALASFAIGFAVFGIDSHVSWYRAVTQSGDWAWLAMNASLFGLVGRSFDESPYFVPIILAPALVKLRSVVAGMVAVISLTVAVLGATSRETDRAFALLLVAAVLVTPLGWVYYLWLPAGPIAALAWCEWRQEHRWPIWIRGLAAVAIVGLGTPLAVPYLFQPHRWATLLLGSIYFWATIALWAWLLLDCLSSGRLAPTQSASVSRGEPA